ncbi:MAG: hypothetical protein RLZZ142_725, partial [Verrucomicrobiota bacterium]
MRSATLLPLLCLAWCANRPLALGAESLPKPMVEFFNQHCTDCHDGSTKKGGVNLEVDQLDWTAPDHSRLLERVHHAIETGDMPPKKKARPPAQERDQVLHWIDEGLLRKTPPQRTVFRRMSRVEYLNTIQRQFLGSFQLPVGFPE